MKKRIAVDMDGVIANLHDVWLKIYNSDYNDNLRKEDITLWNWHVLCKPECGEKLYRYLDNPDLFRNLPVIEGSQEVLKELSSKYDIFICSAPYNINNVLPKVEWLRKNFPFLNEKNFVFTRNKGILNADFLIDDNPDNFIDFRGEGLLFDAPHNREETKYRRVKNWFEIKEYFSDLNKNIYIKIGNSNVLKPVSLI